MLNWFLDFFSDGFRAIRASRLAKILLLILLFKFIMFYGFLKGFLFPRYLKPHYESDRHRSEQVIQDLTRSRADNPHERNEETGAARVPGDD
jgi:hypothetical protein